MLGNTRPHEWLLGLFPLFMGLLSPMFTSYDHMRVFLLLSLCGNLVLLLASAPSAIRSHKIGWLVLLSSYTAMFFAEGVSLAFETPAFPVPPEVKSLQGQYPYYGIRRALLCLGIFQAAFILVWNVQAPVLRAVVHARLSTPRLVLYPLCFFGYVPFLIGGKGLDLQALVDILVKSRTMTRSMNAQDPGWYQYTSAIALYPLAMLLSGAITGKSKRRWIDLVLFLLGSVPFLASGSRHILLYVIGPAALVWLSARVRRLSRRTVLAAAAVLVLGVLTLQIQYAVRYRGWDAVTTLTVHDLGLARPSAMFETLVFATTMVPESYRHFMEPMTPFFVTHWIPRRLWPGKPQSRSYVSISEAWTGTPDLDSYNVPPSIVGQYYINWSYAGVLLIGGWIGLLTKVLDLHTLEARKAGSVSMLVLCGSGYVLLVNFLRIYYPFYVVYFVCMALTAWVSSALGSFLRLGVDRRRNCSGVLAPRLTEFGAARSIESFRPGPPV